MGDSIFGGLDLRFLRPEQLLTGIVTIVRSNFSMCFGRRLLTKNAVFTRRTLTQRQEVPRIF